MAKYGKKPDLIWCGNTNLRQLVEKGGYVHTLCQKCSEYKITWKEEKQDKHQLVDKNGELVFAKCVDIDQTNGSFYSESFFQAMLIKDQECDNWRVLPPKRTDTNVMAIHPDHGINKLIWRMASIQPHDLHFCMGFNKIYFHNPLFEGIENYINKLVKKVKNLQEYTENLYMKIDYLKENVEDLKQTVYDIRDKLEMEYSPKW